LLYIIIFDRMRFMTHLTIIEDNPIDATCIKNWTIDLTNVSVIKHFHTGFDAIHHASTYQSDILVVDMHLPLLCGIETILLLRSNNYTGKVIGTSHAFNIQHKLKLIDLGASGYCQKNKESLQYVLSRVIKGDFAFEHHYFEDWKKRTEERNLFEKDEDERLKLLNPHYKKILLYTYQGLTTSEMAEKMGLKKHTVEQYRSTMLQLLGFCNMSQATSWAVLHKIIITSELPPPAME
jgi:DNA-binding NarL/FixJ family response regulator